MSKAAGEEGQQKQCMCENATMKPTFSMII